MQNKPGLSWGPDMKINLWQAGNKKKWLAVYFESDDKKGETIKIFKPKCCVDYREMIKQVTLWNYGTCELCPIVRAEIDMTA